MELPAGRHQEKSHVYRRIAFTCQRVGLSDSDVVDVVLQIGREHWKQGISGAIWFGETSFFHILEGKVTAVEQAYRLLIRNPCHANVKVLLDRFDNVPRFNGWEMHVMTGPETEALRRLTRQYLGEDEAREP